MPEPPRYHRHTDSQDAVLVGWMLLLATAGVLYFLAYDRMHVRAGQLVEMTIYPLLAGIFLWEVLRYKATKTAKMEAAWPRPIPFVTRRKEEIHLAEARKTTSDLVV